MQFEGSKFNEQGQVLVIQLVIKFIPSKLRNVFLIMNRLPIELQEKKQSVIWQCDGVLQMEGIF